MFIFHEGAQANQYSGEMEAGMAMHSLPSLVNYAALQQT